MVRRFRRALCALLVSGAAQADSAITIDAPAGGWSNSASQATGFAQAVNYPATRVNVADPSATGSLIAGRIRKAPKSGEPLTLVVNGVAMPQRVEADGHFARPYAFPAGSNSVEVRASEGSRARVQRYENFTGRVRPRVRVLLSWDSDNTDLDLHVISPVGEHVYYGDRVGAAGTALDIDVTTGYGPEIVASPLGTPGTWLVYVNYYGGETGDDAPLTTAQVSIITDEGTPREKLQSFQVPMRKAGELTLVRSFQYP